MRFYNIYPLKHLPLLKCSHQTSEINTWLTSYFYWAALIQTESVRYNWGHGSLDTLLFTVQMAESAVFKEQGLSSEHPEDK